jgi:hypothetical protein
LWQEAQTRFGFSLPEGWNFRLRISSIDGQRDQREPKKKVCITGIPGHQRLNHVEAA